MSHLKDEDKRVLKKHVIKGELFEIFPGDSGDYKIKDSINFFHSILKKKTYALGDGKFKAWHVKYIKVKTPPFPHINKEFEYIFMQEPCWLLGVGNNRDGTFLPAAIKFINKHLKGGGKFLTTRSNIPESRKLLELLGSNYTLVKDHNVFIFSKNLKASDGLKNL